MKRGFSLIELLVVVAIIAILVGVATPYYADYVRESKRAKALQDLDVLKQAIVLYNSQEDLPYQGTISTQSTELVPILGENDFNGLQGRYLTYIPVDPWGKNYKIDPFACFVYSEGPDSRVDSDDIKDYYVKDLALVRIEWEDTNNDRLMNPGDLLYFAFNKPLFAETFVGNDFNIYENNEIVDSTAVSASETISLTFTWKNQPAAETDASGSVLIGEVSGGNVKLGVHSLALKDDLAILQKYMEVQVKRSESTPTKVVTEIKRRNAKPLRYAIRTSPVKITPK